MQFQGLSTDQAPPIWVPLRFFITAPFFAVIAGLFVFLSPSDAFLSRFSIESIIATHLLTIGFLAFVMLGALTQMLPVLAGAKIPNPKLLSLSSYIFLVLGLVLMCVGLFSSLTLILLFASISLGIGFFIIIFAIAMGIKSVSNFTPTIKGMRVSIFFASMIVAMGIYLLYGYISSDMSELHLLVANIHSVWAIFGFAGVLIISVSFQVLPMFYVAPHFKSFCKKKVVNILAISLLFWMVLNIFLPTYAVVAKFFVALFFSLLLLLFG